MFVGVISSAVVEFACIGLVILADERNTGVFPRWAGYFNLWVALLVAPAGIVPFFKHGPFAWNGIFSFFMPMVVFAAWVVVMVVLLRRAIDHEEREGERASGDPLTAEGRALAPR
jgi:membrane protein implicated in regulation of membrane protease activity